MQSPLHFVGATMDAFFMDSKTLVLLSDQLDILTENILNWFRWVKVALSWEILENFNFSKMNIPNQYPEPKIWISCCTVLGGKFKFSAQDSDLEYLSWISKNLQVSSDWKPPLTKQDISDNYLHQIYVSFLLFLYSK